MADEIVPRIFKGTRDFLPEDMAFRQRAISTLREVFELYGFLPLETPAVEFLDVLTGKTGSEEDKLIYALAYDGGRTLGLRYDLTVPLSRVVAMYGKSLAMPFKRYQIQPVWRADKPQKGRYREFWQCDVDTVGTADMMADAEIALLVRTAMERLGFPGFTLAMNNRKIINGIMEVCAVPEGARVAACKAVDKLEKQGRDAVEKLLVSEAEAGLGADAAARLLEAVTPGGDPARDLDRVADFLAGSDVGREGVEELRQVIGLVGAADDDPSWLRFAPDMVRGLDYYTGPIFEIKVTEPKVGSLGGGGRYDRLVGQLGGGEGYPATGLAFGLERIVLALSESGVREGAASGAQVLVTVFSDESRPAALRFAAALRAGGLRVEVFLGAGRKLGKQFRLADRKNIPVTAVIGPDEEARGEVKLKAMATGEQVSVAQGAAVEAIRTMLASGEEP